MRLCLIKGTRRAKVVCLSIRPGCTPLCLCVSAPATSRASCLCDQHPSTCLREPKNHDLNRRSTHRYKLPSETLPSLTPASHYYTGCDRQQHRKMRPTHYSLIIIPYSKPAHNTTICNVARRAQSLTLFNHYCSNFKLQPLHTDNLPRHENVYHFNERSTNPQISTFPQKCAELSSVNSAHVHGHMQCIQVSSVCAVCR